MILAVFWFTTTDSLLQPDDMGGTVTNDEEQTGRWGDVIAWRIILLLVPILLAGSFTRADAQAWTKPTGEAYLKLSYGASTASEQYTFDGRRKAYADNVNDYAYFDRSLYLYYELGLADQFTLVASLPYKRIIVRDAAFRYQTSAVGDLQLGVRADLARYVFQENSGNALAANFNVALPTLYYRNVAPSPGAGQIDASLQVAYGRSFYPTPAYAQGGIGYRYRSSIYGLSDPIYCQEGVNKDCVADAMPVFGDQLTFNLEGGYTFGEKLLVQALLNSAWSVKAPETGFTTSNPLPTRTRFIKVGLGLGYEPVDDLGLSLQGFMTPYGRNSVASTDLYFGVDYTFQLFGGEEGE